MKVAMVSEHASPLAVLGGVDAGGQNVNVAALAAALARRGLEVVVHTRRDDPSLPEEVELCPGVTVHHVDAGPAQEIPKDELLPYMDEFADVLRGRWQEWQPEIVHAHFWMSGYAALRAAHDIGVPVAQTFHALGVVKRRYQGERDTSPEERLEIEEHIVRDVDQIVATCTDEAFELIRLGADRGRLTVVPCGVDLQRFTPRGPTEPRRDGMRRVLCVGRLVPRKGMGNAISALALLPDDVELVIAGGPDAARLEDDPEAHRLRTLAADLGVLDRLDLRGRVDRQDLPALVRSADVVVCVPWYEPFGIVPLEAMACGVPVVASAVGGMIDTVVDGVTGLHVPPRDPERAAAVAGALLGDPARGRALGKAGVRRARQLYDWNRIASATHDVYRALAPTARRRRREGRRFARPARPEEHLNALAETLSAVRAEAPRVERWGRDLAARLRDGARVLAVGNGGSAAEAEHFTGELVGRFVTERQPLSAICLHADGAALTAIANDYGAEQAFARQVRAHGRAGDVLLALSTSGRSPNILAAVDAAHGAGLTVWGLTGPAPNPLADACHDAVCIPAKTTATIQEAHLVVVHLVCAAIDRALGSARRPRATDAVVRSLEGIW
jgi:glycosyltransferase involved in cell wall biosynthesis/phosphoheptose isomerase